MIKKISRVALSLIWIYHGIIPKIIFRNDQEVLMNNVFIPFIQQNLALTFTGIVEVIYGLALIVFIKSQMILYPSIFFSIAATIAILCKLPELFTNAFNPFSINIAVCALSIINIIAINDQQKQLV